MEVELLLTQAESKQANQHKTSHDATNDGAGFCIAVMKMSRSFIVSSLRTSVSSASLESASRKKYPKLAD